MAKVFFKVKAGETTHTFPHLRILDCTQTFEIMDNDKATRTMDGAMHRGIIGTYYNYKVKLEPEKSIDGIKEYNKLWDILSNPSHDSVELTIPLDVDSDGADCYMVYKAYITSGSRSMLKYNATIKSGNTEEVRDFWKGGDFNFIAMNPARKPSATGIVGKNSGHIS